ncbi:MAG: hypothetical protein Q8M94_22425, partial [Ignavibacteria bacterium]|nr:hypothetical protein [Ignavibacteria bacterium]
MESISKLELEVKQGANSLSLLDNLTISRHKYLTLYCSKCGYSYEVMLRCGDRTCPDCRYKDYYRLLRAYLPLVQQKNNLRFLTFTLMRYPDPLSRERILFLRKCWIKLTHLKKYQKSIKGGLYSIEAKNKGKGWNIHIHILVEGFYLNQKELSEDWLHLTGDSYIVFIEKCWSSGGALKYLLKYLSKSPEVFGYYEEYNLAFAGLRLVSSFGTWYKAIIKQKEPFKCPNCDCVDWLSEYD